MHGIGMLQILAGKISPALPIGISVGASVLLFVLAQVAMHLYRENYLDVIVRKMADLDPKNIRLQLNIHNSRHRELILKNIRFAWKEGKNWVEIAPISAAPIQRLGDPRFVRKENGGYSFYAAGGSQNEVIIECTLPQAMSEICIIGENPKGRTMCAKVNLSTLQAQVIAFRRG